MKGVYLLVFCMDLEWHKFWDLEMLGTMQLRVGSAYDYLWVKAPVEMDATLARTSIPQDSDGIFKIDVVSRFFSQSLYSQFFWWLWFYFSDSIEAIRYKWENNPWNITAHSSGKECRAHIDRIEEKASGIHIVPLLTVSSLDTEHIELGIGIQQEVQKTIQSVTSS